MLTSANIICAGNTAYTITYDANGGTGAPDPVENLIAGELATVPMTVPTREGYTFLGWAVDSDATWARLKPGDKHWVGEFRTLYAVWKHNGDVDGNGYSTANDLVVLARYSSCKVLTLGIFSSFRESNAFLAARCSKISSSCSEKNFFEYYA